MEKKAGSWSKGFVGPSRKGKKDSTLVDRICNSTFLRECAGNVNQQGELQQLLSECYETFQSCSNPVENVTELLFGEENIHSGLLALSATKATGSEEIRVCSLAETIVETAFTRGWFKSIINFSHFHRLQHGRCSLLSSEVLEWIYRPNGLLFLAEKLSDSAVLLLYFFLSTDYEGASQIWNSLYLRDSDTIKKLCLSLANGFLLRGTLDEATDSLFVGPYVYSLLQHIVEVLHLYKGEADPSCDQVVQILRAFASKYRTPQLTLFLLPKRVNTGAIDEIASVGPWESRLIRLETITSNEQARNNALESQLQEAMAQISSLHSLMSETKTKSNTMHSNIDKSTEEDLESEGGRPEDVPKLITQSDSPSQNVFALGDEWNGFKHKNVTESNGYALLQRNDGKYTVINKAEGKGHIALSVGNEPKFVVDPKGDVGIGTLTPRAKLHVNGCIRCGDSSFAMTALENLTVIRGGFSCRTFEPRRGPGWDLLDFKSGMLEIRFVHPFAKRPSIIATQNIPQQSPALVPIGYIDASKFGFLAGFSKTEVWIEFFVFGQRSSGWL